METEPNLPREVHAVAAGVPQWAGAREISIAPLECGVSLNNTNYRVRVDGIDYVLRIGAETARLVGVHRDEEREIILAASRAGIAPEVLYFDAQGNMVTALIPGRHWEAEDFQKDANIGRIADLLRRMQAVREVRAEGSVFRRIERLLVSAEALLGALQMPPGIRDCWERMRDLETMRLSDPRYQPGLSHNDLWACNFLDDDERLWLLDWEFGGSGDSLYDLATLTMAGGYTEAQQKELLLRAFDYDQSGDLRMLQDMKHVVRFFEGAWGLVQHGIRGTAGFDYLEYSQKMFQKIQDELRT